MVSQKSPSDQPNMLISIGRSVMTVQWKDKRYLDTVKLMQSHRGFIPQGDEVQSTWPLVYTHFLLILRANSATSTDWSTRLFLHIVVINCNVELAL